jgi:hypothetical protein
MEIAAVFLTILAYSAAGYLWYQQRTPIYALALLSGHVSVLASPLWRLLYGVNYSPNLEAVQAILGQPIPFAALLAASWFYPLPALVVIYLYFTRWWFPGPITAVLTYLIFLLYHLLIETLGLSADLWTYSGPPLPFGVSTPVLAAVMSSLTSLGLLYVLLSSYRAAWISMAITIVPATLLISLIVHGLLGAPLWVTLRLGGAGWAISLGLASALALLAWAVYIVAGGLSKVER